MTCRKEGKFRQYLGETLISGHHRVAGHWRDIEVGVLNHPMVQHVWKEHGGVRQNVVMRILPKHQTAPNRQVTVSVNIEKCLRKEGECLNTNSERAGSKIPRIAVLSPKGTITKKEREDP